MSKYELGIEILENNVVVDHQTVYTHAENLDRAQRNIAWRTVVKENPDAEYPGLTIRFEDGRIIDGSKKNGPVPLYIVLIHDLHKKEVYVDETYAKQLRQKYAVNKNNYAEKLAQIVKDFKAEEMAEQGRPEQVIRIDDNFERQDFYDFSSHKEENEMMYEKIEDILNNVLADIELGSCNHVIITGDNGQLNLVKTEKAIDFGRILYARCGEIFNKEHIAEIRKGLKELFGSSKTETDTDYDNLAAEAPASSMKLELVLSLLYKGKNVPVKRQVVFYDEGNDFYAGAVLNGSKKVGTFYWNANFMKPVFKPEPGPVDMGLENKTRYATAIKAALEKAGIKCKAKPRHETQVLFEEAV